MGLEPEWEPTGPSGLTRGWIKKYGMTVGLIRDDCSVFPATIKDENLFYNLVAKVWGVEKMEHQKKITELETYIAKLELMPSDQTWRDLVESVAKEVETIKNE